MGRGRIRRPGSGGVEQPDRLHDVLGLLWCKTARGKPPGHLADELGTGAQHLFKVWCQPASHSPRIQRPRSDTIWMAAHEWSGEESGHRTVSSRQWRPGKSADDRLQPWSSTE
jgi:hypothetical protein